MIKRHPNEEVKGVQPVKLSEVKGEWVLEKGNTGYVVAMADAPSEHVLVCAGSIVGSPQSKFSHPNIAAKCEEVYNFRTYFQSGRKKWYAKPGISFYLLIPKSEITLLPEKGYSYVLAQINGVLVRFNVSGGGGSGPWSDYLRNTMDISVGHSLRDLKKLAEVAVPTSISVNRRNDENEQKHWKMLVAAKLVPNVIAAMKNPTIHFLSGYSNSGEGSGQVTEVWRKTVRHVRPPTAEELKQNPNITNVGHWEDDGALTGFIIGSGGFDRCRVKLTQIDWLKTAEANGLNHLGEVVVPIQPEDKNQLQFQRV